MLYYCGIALFFSKERQMGKTILLVDDEVEITDISSTLSGSGRISGFGGP